MRRALIAVAVVMSLAVAVSAQDKQPATPGVPALAGKVRKLWEAYKSKNKATLASLIDDDFRQFEEGLSTFGDKKTEVNSVDEFDLVSYTLSDFTIKPVGPNAALVTYIAQYEGRSGGQSSKAKSVFGEIWVRTGSEWKASYMQETYVK